MDENEFIIVVVLFWTFIGALVFAIINRFTGIFKGLSASIFGILGFIAVLAVIFILMRKN